MKFINKIVIKYFRSVYNLNFENISETLTVFTGKNDVGKSNILRALNLFFNGETDVSEKILFERDFSKIRKKEIKEKSKERQLISIAIEFKSPSSYASLPRTFWVTKIFDRYNQIQIILDNTIPTRSQASVTRFLNSIEYTYIPAIKDKDTFNQVLNKLKTNLPDFADNLLSDFNKKIKAYGSDLRFDLKSKINLSPYLTLPSTMQELLVSLDFSIDDDIITTSLSQRGDGIRCRFIPAIMNYIAINSKKLHIWGLEEPENSLEFIRSSELEKTIEKEYSKHAQIFATSHSPAFVGDIPEDAKKLIYLLTRNSDGKVSEKLINRDLLIDDNKIELSKELGYMELQKDLANCLRLSQEKVYATQKKLEEIYKSLSKKTNILLVEGETDEMYIKKAMKLYDISGFDVFWVGQNIDGKAKFGGDESLQQVQNALEYNDQFLEGKKIILLYDFDSKKRDLTKNNLYVRSTVKNNNESIFKKGIENLLVLPDNFNREGFYEKHNNTGSYGEKSESTSFNKMKLCNFLCNDKDASRQRGYFANIKSLLDNISSIFETAIT
jgi:predicted ATP-dependent endonuclease of OLD family